MKRIDKETVQRILDAADIVEVVSDFVSLKKHGNSYVGLCPFHSDRNPSFSVNRARGICKCFSCGKGGSPVNFLMQLEQFTYYDALIYLAKKYNIEVKERELTDKEKSEENEREALIAVNDFALDYFEKMLRDTADGRDIGLSYFRERGINDAMIKKFRLGYSLDKPDALYQAATRKGFTEKALLDTGLCAKSERGVYDRFRGRVIYPIFTVSGRVVAFGARTLKSDKSVAKYLNSPESAIYHKSNELYGFYQAKPSIVKRDKCILVEGYMDVISMHQVGVDYVVASSGTALTEGQIRLIHRFTKNVTLIYDADAAGNKAMLRGIDMLLAEGCNVRLLNLPKGEDPDSFAQSHSATEVEKYITDNETDFVKYKKQMLLDPAGDDPIQRAEAINSILKTIAVIPDPVTQAVYLQECSRMLGIDEKVLRLRIDKEMSEKMERLQKAQNQQALEQSIQKENTPPPQPASRLFRPEKALAKYIVKYGMSTIALKFDEEEDENLPDFTVLSYIQAEFENDSIGFTNPVYAKIYAQALEIMYGQWTIDFEAAKRNLDRARKHELEAGVEEIRLAGKDLAEMETLEQRLNEKVNADYDRELNEFTVNYLEEIFLSSPDDDVRREATELAAEKYQLSKVHTKFAHIETEQERLPDLLVRAVLELKFAILEEEINKLNNEIRQCGSDMERANDLMKQLFDLYLLKSEFSKLLGERIVNPK